MVGPGRGSKWEHMDCHEQVHVTVASARRVWPPLSCCQGRCVNDPTFSILCPPQDKQNEASYLRDHKEELTEELATTILQRVG